MNRLVLIALAGLFGAIGIAARAYEAHGILSLPDISEPRLRNFSAGTEILLLHALALLGIAGLASALPRASLWLGLLLAAGTLLFAAPLLSFALTGARSLIALTPVGGMMLIAGWAGLALFAVIGIARGTKTH